MSTPTKRSSKFPRWVYHPANSHPPAWVDQLIQVVSATEPLISTAAGRGLDSNGVLNELNAGLRSIGFDVERGKTAPDRITRPVLFGEHGAPTVTMDIDAFHDGQGVVLEVEAGRAWNGNAVYRDLVRASLLLDARFLALAVPVGYAPQYVKRPIPVFDYTAELLRAIYASQRLKLPFEGILLIGY